jgi:hypothetical protein
MSALEPPAGGALSAVPPTAEGLSPLSPAACAHLRAAQLPRLPLRAVAFVHPKQRAQLRDADAFLAHAQALLHDGGASAVDALAVRRVPDGHPAYPGFGLFARAALRAETLLSEYGGDLLAEAECAARDPLPDGSRNTCMFGVCLSEDAEMDIDGTPQPRALAAYVNDYTGIRTTAAPEGFTQEALRAAGVNTRFLEVLCGGGCLCKGGTARQPAEVHPHLLMYTIADVAPGHELLTLYGAAYWRVHDAALQAQAEAPSDSGRDMP